MSKPLRLLPFLVLTSLLILPGRAWAGTAVLLQDIVDDPLSSSSSDLRQVVPYGDQVAFIADVFDNRNYFTSLWLSDGTGPGTRTVFQDCAGFTCELIPQILGVVNGFLLFSAEIEGDEYTQHLWRTDGTRAGTIRLTAGDLPLPDFLIEDAPIVVTDEFLYYFSCDADQCGIARSDGTPAGTRLWKPGGSDAHGSHLTLAGDRLYSVSREGFDEYRLWVIDTKTGSEALLPIPDFPYLLTAAGGKLFFAVTDGEEGRELWVSDGTAKGTRALTHFEASDPFDLTGWMKEIGNRLYFVVNDVVHGFELWRSDGTPQGTVRISDFGNFYALGTLRPDGVAEVGGKVLFVAEDGLTATKLWISNGRPESTRPFRSLCGPGSCELPQSGSTLVQIGRKVFFSAENGLWSTDGTLAGTHRFAGPMCGYQCGHETLFQELRGKIAFIAYDEAHGVELWESDGTEAGTRRLTDVPGQNARPGRDPVVAAGRWIYFTAGDRHGREPWVTDGRETRILADIGRSAPGSGPEELTPVGNRLFFTASDGLRRNLWISGGTPESTLQIPISEATGLVAASGRLFFRQGIQLWSTDGGAPVQITHLDPASDSAVYTPIEFQGRLLVPIRTGEEIALWQSTDTGDGLVKKVDLPGVLSIQGLWALGNEAYFQSWPDAGLWRTDGTQEGTRKLAEVRIDSGPARLGSSVLFTSGNGLWKTDGTPAGTVLVRELPGDGSQELTVFQGRLYFFHAWGLWRSDGTAEGTVLVRQLAYEEDGPDRFGLMAFAGKLFFIAADETHGRELWTSDGTAEGTRMLLDLNPGKPSGAPDPSTLTVGGGRLFFTGNDGIHGTELWESDGTAAGTRLVQDLAPEAASARPAELAVAGDHLFFVADDLLSGRESWALPLAGPEGCQPSSTRLCLNDGRYQVEAAWLTGQGQAGTGKGVPLSGDTGYFWFFDPDNVEAVVKILDGQGLNGHVWVFYGALSNVEYTITVTDTQTGLTRRYFNPLGTLASVGDTHGFGPLGASSANPVPPVARAAASPLPLVAERTDFGREATEPCQASAGRLCLNDGRFAVEVSWKDFQSHTGTGTAVPLTRDTGTFWFFSSANIELVVKVLDGRPINGKHWVFYGALSNVEYTLTITDTETGTVRTYKNPSGRFASVADTGAF